MQIVTINVGTSSVKCALFEVLDKELVLKTKSFAYPLNNPINCIVKINYPNEQIINTKITDFEEALCSTLEAILPSDEKINSTIFVFRIVHGGNKLSKPTLINSDVISYLNSIKNLAPLHNPPAIYAITVIKDKYPKIPAYAVFDTSFHSTMPDYASSYAISDELKKFNVKRYGFHGLAHSSMLSMYVSYKKIENEDAKIITLQLGSGCSICAINKGKSIDTSMGFSPLEGLISRTRSGNIDPSVVTFLSDAMQENSEKIIERLNKQSGLSGISGTTGEMSELLKLEKSGNRNAELAVTMFTYRIIQYLGAYDAILNGANAFIFGGGIIEHNPIILQRIFSSQFFGINIKEELFFSKEILTKISNEQSKKEVYISLVDEEKQMAIELNNQLTLNA